MSSSGAPHRFSAVKLQCAADVNESGSSKRVPRRRGTARACVRGLYTPRTGNIRMVIFVYKEVTVKDKARKRA